MIHVLKIWPEYYAAVRDRTKKFEYRREDDRRFEVGDRLDLREFEPGSEKFSGNGVMVLVTYCLRGPAWGLPDKTVIMSIDLLDSKENSASEKE